MKNMGFWDILGIAQTDDIRQIKRAYARQISLNNPEDDPDAFVCIREAYERAMDFAQGISGDSDASERGQTEPERPGGPPVEIGSQAASVWNMLMDLYNDFERRMNLDEWRRFVGGLNINEYLELQNMLCTFLFDYYVLPGHIFQYLMTEFDIGEDQLLHEMLIDGRRDVCSPILKIFSDGDKPDFDLAQYAQLRVDAYIAHQSNDLDAAEAFSRQAIELFDGDYLMYGILGDALAVKGKKPEAAQAHESEMLLKQSYMATIEKNGPIPLIFDRKERGRFANPTLAVFLTRFLLACGIFFALVTIGVLLFGSAQ